MKNISRLNQILGPTGPELTCRQCFNELDRYVELELSGCEADTAVPGIRAHLDGCVACGEDHLSLTALILAADSRSSPPGGLR